MPNLSELVADVNTTLDYNPDLNAYRNQVRRAINRHYLEVSSQYPWLFLIKQVDFQLYAPVEGEAGVTIVRDATNLRLVIGSGTSFGSHYEGQYLIVGGTKKRIVHVESTTQLYIESPFENAEIDSATTEWQVKFEAYDLPVDLVDVLGIMSRDDDRGRIVWVDYRKEEEQFLDSDISGDPIVAIDKPFEYTEAPTLDPTATTSGGGALQQNQTFEYMYTIKRFGRESAPSKIVEATTDTLNRTVDLSNLESLDFSTGNWSGRVRRIYRRNQDRGGRFYLLAEQSGASLGTTFQDDGSNSVTFETEVYEEDGARQRMRMWFTPGSDTTVELRYQSIPRKLQSDNDQPVWPKQYHHLLVYLALKDAGMQHGMTGFAQHYERRAEDLIRNMRERYLTRQNRDYIRQGFDRRLAGYNQYERWGIPSKQ